MKKIVALVLAMVMVLGLATVASAATKPAATWTALEGSYDLVAVNDADGKADAGNIGLTVKVSNAKAPKDVAVDGVKDGKIDNYGWVKGFEVTWGSGGVGYYVQVPTLADADEVFYYTGSTTLLGYFAYVGADTDALYYLGTPAAFTNFGEECGQLNEEPAEDTDYYFFEGVVYEESSWTLGWDEILMVGGVQVPVNEFAEAADFVAHAPVYTYDKDYEVVAVVCDECGATASIYANFASVPKADKVALNFFPVNDGEFYCWNAAKAPAADAETDKVESAETFDAGIAMYVGMSVMAAAGSAVVLKKKD